MAVTTTTTSRWTVMRTVLSLFVVVGLVLGAFAGTAFADKVHKKFKGQIVLSTSPFSTSFKGDGDAIKYLDKVKTRKFTKDKRGKWSIEFWAFLSEKLEAKEAVIIFKDVTYRDVEPTEVYSEGVRPANPHDNFIISFVELDEEFFKPGMTYEMTIKRSRNTKALATVEFELSE